MHNWGRIQIFLFIMSSLKASIKSCMFKRMNAYLKFQLRQVKIVKQSQTFISSIHWTARRMNIELNYWTFKLDPEYCKRCFGKGNCCWETTQRYWISWLFDANFLTEVWRIGTKGGGPAASRKTICKSIIQNELLNCIK